MISVTRSSCPPELGDADSKGKLEAAAALLFYASWNARDEQFKFSAYKQESVQEQLQKLFKGKCAYCESDYRATSPTDFEHFRPKGGVMLKNGLRTPGYYWLGSDWENLLPSCIDCNRRRNQEIAGESKRRLAGKGNLFPLLAEFSRAKAPGEEIHEEPLLLNPCVDKVEDHLEFVDDGLLLPAVLNDGTESRKGRETIDVLGLNRIGLVERRAVRLIYIDSAIRRVRECSYDIEAHPGSKIYSDRLDRSLTELKELSSDKAEYTLMARQRLRQQLAGLV